MTRHERRVLLAAAIVLAVICSALFARAVLAQRAADLAHAQARAALVPLPTTPASDFTQRTMLAWSGGTEQMRYWQALQRFRLVTTAAQGAANYTLLPPLPLIFKLEETVAWLRKVATEDSSPSRRSRLEDMLGLAYYVDAELHRGEIPVEPELDGRAIAAFRSAVLLDGSDDAAKTNLEVLLRKQLASKKPVEQHPPPVPDLSRVQALLQSANGIPSQNGAVGRRLHGGY